MTLSQAVAIVRMITAIVICIDSLLSAVHALKSTTESTIASLLPWIAATEALAALMLLARQTVIVGGVMLIALFGVALIVHGPVQQLHLFVYGAVIVLLMTATRKQSQ